MCIGFLALPVLAFLARKVDDPLLLIRKGWLICFLLMSVVSIIEIITYKHLPSSEPTRVLGGVGITVPHTSVTFGNVNNYGAFIVFVAPYLLWGILDAKNKLLYFTALFLGVLFVIINGSRMGVFVAGFQIVCFLVLFIKKLKLKYIIGELALLSFIIVLLSTDVNKLFYTANRTPVAPSEVDDSGNKQATGTDKLFYTIRYRTSGMLSEKDESTNERLAMIKCGLEMLKESNGFGVGAGGFEAAVVHQPSFSGKTTNPHNLFVEIFAQYGVLMAVFFCFWLFSILYRAWHNNNLSPGGRMAVYVTVITLPFIGAMNSASLGFTYMWLFLSLIAIVATYRPERKEIKN
jgi:O-antigen ligase